MKLGITIDERILAYHLGDSHPMNSKRVFPAYHLIREKFIDLDELDIISPVPSGRDTLELAHRRDYVEAMNELSKNGEGERLEYGLGQGDCPVWKGMSETSEFIVDSTVSSVERVYNQDFGIAFELLGGLHHARAARASGFCYYNDINVAVHRLKKFNDNIRILYIDTDVHHGDGTQFEFYRDPNVVTISFHESGQFIFPGTGFPDEIGEKEGMGSSINHPFFPYTYDGEYLDHFKKIIPSIFESFEPDFVIWQAGVDGHRDDLLGHLRLTNHTYHNLARIMRNLVIKMDTPRLVALGGGGYNPFSVAKSWAAIIAGLNNQSIPRTSSSKWVDLCREKGINVSNHLVDEITTRFDHEQSEEISVSNKQYIDTLKTKIQPYFSF